MGKSSRLQAGSFRDHRRKQQRSSRATLYHTFFIVILMTGLADTVMAQTVRFSSASSSQPVNVTADFYRPSGAGPFSAVVLLHTCGGVGSKEAQYATALRSDGYVVVVPDSFASRGNRKKGNRCIPGNYENHVSDSVSDALGAAIYLRSLPFANRDRIAIMGMSLGGTAVLALPPEAMGHGIRAAISYYPPCVQPDGNNFFKDSKIPLLLPLGELDNWSPAAACVEKAEQIKNSGRTIEWTVYPATHHGFDNQAYYFATNDNRGRTMQYSQTAADDSWNRFKAFLAKHLAKES